MLAVRSRRYRSSTSASAVQTSKAAEVLQSLLDRLIATTKALGANGYPDIDELIDHIRRIHQHIAAARPPSPPQDDFRYLRGFQTLLDVLRSFSGFYNPQKRTEAERVGLFDLLHVILATISALFRGHPGNRRYFQDRVEGGGWEALEQIIASIGVGGGDSDLWTNCQLFGKLLSFSLDDQRFDELCRSVAEERKLLGQTPTRTVSNTQDGVQGQKQEVERQPADAERWMVIQDKLKAIVGPTTVVQNPEIIRTIVGFWESIPRTEGAAVSHASMIVLTVLSQVASVSFFNLTAIHGTGILSRLLRVLFSENRPLAEAEQDNAAKLCRQLISLGIDELADAQFLLSRQDAIMSEFCVDMSEKHNGPPFVQFDLSLHGHASIELPSLGRTFPPHSAPGYTFTAWVRVDRFDPKSHTTLFGVFDSTQTCFLLAYLEKDTKNFILQTSVTSSRPSVRFKSVVFKASRWYHIAIVHRKPKALTTSKASLFVNGEFAEQIRSSYPSTPPISNASTDSFASLTSNTNKTNPVQAFLGTPRDLATQVGPGLVHSKWSLASAHLFEDVLSDDLLAVHYRLGPRYQGNFQDCLGSFQTYEASAALGLRNEIFHPGKDEVSDILRAIRDKAGAIVPEHKVLLSMLPRAVFRTDGKFMESTLFRSLSRHSITNLLHSTTKNGTPVAINGAVSCINDALIRANGSGLLTGDPILATPYYFDDNLWRLAGFTPVALKIVERTTTGDDLVRAVEIMLHCITHSWRNSEAMERDNGYAILSMLLRAKLGYGASASDNPSWKLSLSPDEKTRLTFQLLSLVLSFVGYNHADPIESFIVNPLAYRILLIDPDFWRKSAPIIQELYYKQFVTFAVNSKHHQFNSRRLLRMRIIKRLLDALKTETISEDILPHFLTSFEALVRCSLSAEVYRSLALFITYTFHTPANSLPRTPRALSSASRSVTPGPGPYSAKRATLEYSESSSSNGSRMLTRKQLGVKMLEMYTRILCEKNNLVDISRFAKTVTNKWLLYLLAENDPEIVVYGCKILARLLVTQPTSYTAKFASKTGGFWIMAHRLKNWWDIPTLWAILFSILFGYDVAQIDFDKSFDFFSLLEIFGDSKVVYPDVLSVMTAMLQHGLRDILRYQDDPDSPAAEQGAFTTSGGNLAAVHTRPRARSMELGQALESRRAPMPDKERVTNHASILQTVVRFMADMYSRSQSFRDFTLASDYVRLLLSALYPIVVSADPVSPETELGSKDSSLNFDGVDVIIRPVAGSSSAATPIVRTASIAVAEQPTPPSGQSRGTPLRRPSSFILVAQDQPMSPPPSRLNHVMSPKKRVATQQVSNVVLESILELIISVFNDQILSRKDFTGFGLFLKVPPGFQEHQAYFETYILRNAITQLRNAVQLDQKALLEPRVLQNMSRLNMHMAEAIFEGWFINGAETMLDFTGTLLEYLQRPDVSSTKSVRLCSSAVNTIRATFLKLVLLKLSDMDDPQTTDQEATSIMEKLLYWQAVLLNCLSLDDDFMKLLWYQFYNKLVDVREPIRLMAAMLWRIMLVQKPEESSMLFRRFMSSDQQPLARGFRRLTQLDDQSFLEWVDSHRLSLDILFFGGMSKTWEDYVRSENQRTADTARSRMRNRKDKLRQWHTEAMERDSILLRHEMSNNAWMKSIYFTEHFKHQRLQQDQQDDNAFLASSFAKMERELTRPGAVFAKEQKLKWKLDRTEGRNRMRLRLLPDYAAQQQPDYQPRGNAGSGAPASSLAASHNSSSRRSRAPSSVAQPQSRTGAEPSNDSNTNLAPKLAPGDSDQQSVLPEDDYELVDDPNEQDEDAFEDKNRKVMRRLQQGDMVQNVYNISRIIGLDASEGILIIGKEALYLMDNLFQSPDGEIINVWQAPPEDRDPFSVMISSQSNDRRQGQNRTDQESRSWRWQDVLSVSKRRFLFRDVAIEIFFTDGRSYLFTALNSAMRDEIYSRMMNKTPHSNGPNLLPTPEDAWRLESLKFSEEAPQTLGMKFGSIFNSSAWNPMMRKWQKGEISNFHYLMLVNTMAGRTFNDLTQYPVFPWVLADYTSEELDLNDPATFRDLSKPMGAQKKSRMDTFIAKYQSLAEMDEQPYHYGTHYSSAMIVSSYLIRLPPFVQTFILMQGGSFDHADRLFYSIQGAWESASRDNGTDVRELTPEFFYLPEFLTNINGYNFGTRQGDGGKVDNVILPPWAKGDPKIFIAKNREALESPYVSQRLHQWIDLVFGYKQRGDAAVEACNVFHPLSYKGGKDLDNISDPQERLIATNIIHNFGQTPHQVFTKPHPAREHARCPIKRLDTSVHALTKQPHPLLDSHERVSSLIYAPKLDRLLCASPFRLNLPPQYDKFLEWGYADGSVRFFFTNDRKPAGLFENLHIGQISTLTFADSKTLITAGEDCVVSVYTVQSSPGKPVELVPRSSLFGHKTPVTTIAVSKAFSTFVTVSQDGISFLWDLNRLEFIRKLPLARPVECARIHDVTGEIMLCSGPSVLLYTLNGELILDQNVCSTDVDVTNSGDYIHSCAFYEGTSTSTVGGGGNEWVEENLVFTGHKRGRVNVWRKTVDYKRGGKWVLELVRRLDHVNTKSETGQNVEAAITCITPMPSCVYTGDDDGRVYEWNLIQRER